MELGSLMDAVMGKKIFCPKCNQEFKVGDVLEFVVSRIAGEGAILIVEPQHKTYPIPGVGDTKCPSNIN